MRKVVKETPTQEPVKKPRSWREKAIFVFGAAVGISIWWLASSIYSYAEVRVANSCIKYEMVEIEGRYFECREIGG